MNGIGNDGYTGVQKTEELWICDINSEFRYRNNIFYL